MTRIELDRMLEKAVAEAIGVPYRAKPGRRAYRPKSPAAYQPVHPQHSARELQHA
jgi:hypothetical protein